MRSLSTLAALALLALPVPAHADTFAAVVGGLTTPLGDSNWTDAVESSPTLGVRAGTIHGDIGGMLTLDWVPETTDAMGGTFAGGSSNVSAHRFRILANLAFEHRVAPKVTVAGRVGAGLDIVHASVDINVGPITSNASDTDVNVGFELGGGVWFDVGSVQLGGELGLPIATHSHKATASGEITFDWTSYDLALVFGLRTRGD
jgi:opacity protein-like surface antigen